MGWNRNARLAGLAGAAFLLAAGALASPGPNQVTPPKSDEKLIVHEWGTFLSVQGSDGGTLGGMVESEEKLPKFVRERSLAGGNRACWMSKMETPVTYFYVDQPRKVEVQVDMPGGMLTHWFPAVHKFGPLLPTAGKPATGRSFLDWGEVQLVPPGCKRAAPDPGLRFVDEKDPWRFARETDSAYVKIPGGRPHVRPQGETEKFLFYRGLGAFAPPLTVQTSGADNDVRLTLHNHGPDALRGMFAVRVQNGTIQFAPLGDLPAGATASWAAAEILSAKRPLQEGVPLVQQAVAEALTRAGLYEKEARAMVHTWEQSYFRTEGFRVLYVLPRETVDGLIPIHIKPAPQELVRVMVGRTELLTPAAERRIEKAVKDLGANDPKVKKAAGEVLASLGRYQEPALHRIAALTAAPDVRARAEALIKAAAKQ